MSAIDKEMLKSIVDNFDKVLIHSRDTIAVCYGLPNPQRFANCNIWLPICNRLRTRPGAVEPAWDQIAKEDDARLTRDARILKKRLLTIVGRVETA